MQQEQPCDFVIVTGRMESLICFVSKAVAYFDLNWQEHIDINLSFFRPNEIQHSVGNPERTIELLHWSKPTDVDGMIERMCAAQSKKLNEFI